MARPVGFLEIIARAVILVFVGLVAIVLTGSIFMIFFVLVVGAVIWDQHDRIRALEAKMTSPEKSWEQRKNQE